MRIQVSTSKFSFMFFPVAYHLSLSLSPSKSLSHASAPVGYAFMHSCKQVGMHVQIAYACIYCADVLLSILYMRNDEERKEGDEEI